MATTQEYLREISLHVAPEYAGALRDGADLIDRLEGEKTEHSKGPWIAETFCDGSFNIVYDKFVIAARNGYPNWEHSSESQANARLIAAAPDLLDALTDLLELHEDEGDRPAVAAARAAIAKATAKGK